MSGSLQVTISTSTQCLYSPKPQCCAAFCCVTELNDIERVFLLSLRNCHTKNAGQSSLGLFVLILADIFFWKLLSFVFIVLPVFKQQTNLTFEEPSIFYWHHCMLRNLYFCIDFACLPVFSWLLPKFNFSGYFFVFVAFVSVKNK